MYGVVPQSAFNGLDLNKDGSLTPAELSDAFMRMGLPADVSIARVRQAH
jgi:hypothetical protein